MSSQQLVNQIIKEFPGIRGFAKVDENGNPHTQEGLVLVYKNHVLAVDVKNSRVIDCGVFLSALSTTDLEDFCIECWQEHFGEYGHRKGTYALFVSRKDRGHGS